MSFIAKKAIKALGFIVLGGIIGMLGFETVGYSIMIMASVVFHIHVVRGIIDDTKAIMDSNKARRDERDEFYRRENEKARGENDEN